MAVEFAKGLMVSEVVGVEALERALFVAVSNDSPLEHALLDIGALSEARLEDELARGDAPVLHEVIADVELMDRLPAGLCSRLLAVPLRYDSRSNTVDLAVVNVFDSHAAEEIAFHLQANVVAVRASLFNVEAALRNRPSYVDLAAARTPLRKPTNAATKRHLETHPPEPVRIAKRTPPWGTDVTALSSLSGSERNSDIPIPLTRRRSLAPDELPVPSIRPQQPSLDGDEGLAALTYARLGGGLSLPDAALVRSRSSSPAPEPEDSGLGLRIDSLPAAAVELSARPSPMTAAPSTDRDGTRELPSSQAVSHGLALPPSTATAARAGGLPLAAPTGGRESTASLPAPPDTERGLSSVIPPAISLRDGPRTVHNAGPRPPPISVRAPSIRPAAFERGSIPPPISVRAPSIRPPEVRANTAPRTSTKSFPPPDPAHVVAALKTAPDRDAILGYVLAGGRVVARRVALFVAKKGSFVGWSCTPEFGDEAALTALSVPQDAPTVLNWASNEGTYLGPLDPSSHGPLLAVMGEASRDVASVPIRVSGRTAMVIVADDLGDTMIGTKRLEEIARAAGDALLRVMRTAKK